MFFFKLINKCKYLLNLYFCKLSNKISPINIEVMSIPETLNIIKNENKKVVRFGDGEFNLIAGESIPFQDYNQKLAYKLNNILLGNNNLLVCLPDIFNNLSQYNNKASDFWTIDLVKQKKIYKDIEKVNKIFGNAFISRPYMDFRDKSQSQYYFNMLKKIWDKKNILIVEGKNSRSGVGNNLFKNSKQIRRIICPPKNAYNCIANIERAIIKYKEDSIILLMLGPTSKVIVNDLKDIDNQIIDIGHIDSEYEWFIRGAKKKIKIPGKHTAEFNFDKNIGSCLDSGYQEEIIENIENEE